MGKQCHLPDSQVNHLETRAFQFRLALSSPERYQGGMLRSAVLSVSLAFATHLLAQEAVPAPSANQSNQVTALATNLPLLGPAPSENRYDVLSKMITPMAGVLLAGNQTTDRALTLHATVGQVAGRLPAMLQGASFTAKIQYPGCFRLDAPVLGQNLTVCRYGNKVWAVPGSKVQFLLDQFQHKPRPQDTGNLPLQLPFTAQQAVLLPALFQLENTALSNSITTINGASCRVIEGGLMPEIGKAAKADDFSAKLWICSDYTPKRIDIRRSDFALSFLIDELTYLPSLPASTWQPPQGTTDIYRCDASHLEELLYVVMNSLQMTPADKPWLNEANPSSTQGVFSPMN
jgi:hypothetical protein